MKNIIFLLILISFTACTGGSSSSPLNPRGIDPTLDYSVIEITYMEIFYDADRARSKYYMLATIENKSDQSFTDLHFDGTNEFDETDEIFNLNPYEIINIDSSDYQGIGTMPSGTYETLFFITPFLDFNNIIASAYDSIIIEWFFKLSQLKISKYEIKLTLIIWH